MFYDFAKINRKKKQFLKIFVNDETSSECQKCFVWLFSESTNIEKNKSSAHRCKVDRSDGVNIKKRNKI